MADVAESLISTLEKMAILSQEIVDIAGAMGWQPIDTAPKDGEDLLCYWRLSNCCSVLSWWSDQDIPGAGLWHDSAGSTYNDPTHWMPLPAPPQHHDSDCAIHNMPAMPNGPCDCSLSK